MAHWIHTLIEMQMMILFFKKKMSLLKTAIPNRLNVRFGCVSLSVSGFLDLADYLGPGCSSGWGLPAGLWGPLHQP